MFDDVRVYWHGPRRNRGWDLHKGVKGVRLAGGLSGLHLPDFDQTYAKPARKRGRLYRGTRWNGRQVGLNVLVGDPVWANRLRHGGEWRNLDAKWHDDLSETELGRLCFVTNRGYRWLWARLDSASDPQYPREPGCLGMARYSYVFGAEDAFYSGFDEHFTLFDRAKGVSSAKVRNPGEITVYPKYEIKGPLRLRVGVPGRMTTLPFAVHGETLYVDTDPDVMSVVNDKGVSRRHELERDHDLSIPLDGEVPLVASEISAGGSGTAKVIVSPRYRRAW